MACGDDHAVYNEEDLDDDDDYEETLDPPPNVIDEEDDDVDVDDDDSTSSSNLNLGARDPPLPHSSIHPPLPASSSKPAPGDVTIAVAGVPSDPFRPDLKRQRIEDVTVAAAVVEEKKPSAAFDESRKLFQRLWTDEDEIELLQGFLEYTAQRGATNSSHHHHHDTTAFYDQIKSKLQLDFNKNQLVEKLRRLKKKYRNVVSKIVTGKEYVFKSAHDQATFEISSKIWSNVGSVVRGGSLGSTAAVEDGGYDDDEANPNQIPNFTDHIPNPTQNGIDPKTPRSRKRSRAAAAASAPKMEEKQGFSQPPYQPSGVTNVVTPTATPNANANASSTAVTPPFKAVTLTPAAATPKATATSIPSLIEETVKSCLSPIFKELMNNVMNMNGSRGLGLSTALGPMPLGFGGEALSPEMMADKKWRRQQMLELEVYSRRLELVQDQIKAQLEQLRSMGS